MNGNDINERVAELLREIPTVMGYHHPDSRRATLAGFPDWVFLGPRGILFREGKGIYDTLSLDQRRVGRLISCTGDWQVWGPRDIITGAAEKQLLAIALGRGNGETEKYQAH